MAAGYGTGSQLQQREQGNAPTEPMAPVEQVSSIHESTIKQLHEARLGLDVLLAKIRGAQPSGTAETGKVPQRYLLGDAYEIRSVANDISRQVGELHRVIGHEK